MNDLHLRRASAPATSRLLHSFRPNLDSIMSLAYYVCPQTARRLVMAGTQSGAVFVLDMQTLQTIKTLWPTGRQGAMSKSSHRPVLCLSVVIPQPCSPTIRTDGADVENETVFGGNESFLVSASSDGLLRCWSLCPQKGDLNADSDRDCRFIIHAVHDCGDIFAMAYHRPTDTLYLACKNGSIQWFPMSQRHRLCRKQMRQQWAKRDSRFFSLSNESRHSLGEIVVAQPQEVMEEVNAEAQKQHRTFLILEDMILPMAHNGYIYCLLISRLPGHQNDFLFTGSGDGTVKIWDITRQQRPDLLRTLQCTSGSVLSLHVREGLLYTGIQGGSIRVWDLETFHCIRVLSGHKDDVLAIAGCGPLVFTGSADGQIRKWNLHFECVQTIGGGDQQRAGGVFALTIAHNNLLISGGEDGLIRLWDVALVASLQSRPVSASASAAATVSEAEVSHAIDNLLLLEPLQDRMLEDLEKFISFRSVSGQDGRFREDCRLAAKFLKSLLTHLGAEAKLVAGSPGRNPLVLAKFSANQLGNDCMGKNILFYGHYDVQPANVEQWHSDPFRLSGRDGFLYGRGASDNKGPILATIYAAHELYENRKLKCNMYFLVEGEEESGSIGFYEAVMENKEFFGDQMDGILISNSYWLNDDIPCLTYGLRGVIHSTLEIKSPREEDLHSGVYGGALDEPLVDLIKILSSLYDSKNLTDSGSRVSIPHFQDTIRPVSDQELQSYRDIAKYVAGHGKYASDSVETVLRTLQQRWRQPTLTIHKVDVSGPAGSNNTVIPKSATAAVSMRIVPDQQLADVIVNYQRFVMDCFVQLKSRNQFSMTVGHRADWWVADRQSLLYRLAAESIAEEWGVQPLHIREGGSIPAIPFLEKAFKTGAVHIPMGQASDNAHLPDERIRLQNLHAGRRVITRFLEKIQ